MRNLVYASIITTVLFSSSVMAQTKVIVVPLGGKVQSPAYTDNGDGTITDYATNLIWEKTDDGASVNLTDALIRCEDLFLAGKLDWRVPSKEMLKSLVRCSNGPHTPLADFATCASPKITPTNDPILNMNGSYWTDEVYNNSPTLRYVVNFNFGDTRTQHNFDLRKVRCVRIGY